MTRLRVQNALQLEHLLPRSQAPGGRDVLSEEAFRRMIAVERKRSERTNEPFLLMLIECVDRPGPSQSKGSLNNVMTALFPATRETDVLGWYREHATIGVLFIGLASDNKTPCLGTILSRVSGVLQDELTFEQFSEISITLHVFPDEWNQNDSGGVSQSVLYPDLEEGTKGNRAEQGIKRVIDLLCCTLLILFSAPLLLVIAIAVKLTSRGPILFKQQRVGQYGRYFTFLKFRTMWDRNDHSEHRQYVTQLIAGTAERIAQNGNGGGVYKLANDPRVTPLGKFLRKTSLDELPQFFNVLKGEMSLVGPRPPIPYEVAAYKAWHRRRVLQVKPGITGLWQVTGRSQVSFDEMVRLDLQYASFWSLWLDFKILMRTPAAVIKGAH